MDWQSVFDRIGLKNMNGGREKRKNLSSTVKLYKRRIIPMERFHLKELT